MSNNMKQMQLNLTVTGKKIRDNDMKKIKGGGDDYAGGGIWVCPNFGPFPCYNFMNDCNLACKVHCKLELRRPVCL
jgi:hypothetical protein